MKSFIKFALILLSLIRTVTYACADDRWTISAGANVSHMYGQNYYLEEDFGWGPGCFIGAGYEARLSRHWNLTPQLELSYVNNGATLSRPYFSDYLNRDQWRDSWSVLFSLPVGFRFSISEAVGMKVSAGPYMQESFHVRRYDDEGAEKINETIKFGDMFNCGVTGGISVETGKHLAYLVNARYPILKYRWSRQTLTISLGVRYYF